MSEMEQEQEPQQSQEIQISLEPEQTQEPQQSQGEQQSQEIQISLEPEQGQAPQQPEGGQQPQQPQEEYEYDWVFVLPDDILLQVMQTEEKFWVYRWLTNIFLWASFSRTLTPDSATSSTFRYFSASIARESMFIDAYKKWLLSHGRWEWKPVRKRRKRKKSSKQSTPDPHCSPVPPYPPPPERYGPIVLNDRSMEKYFYGWDYTIDENYYAP